MALQAGAMQDYFIYTLIFTKTSQQDVLPRLGGPPVAGYRSELLLWPQIPTGSRTRGGLGHASAGTTTNLFIIIIFLIYHLYAYIGFIHIYIQIHPQYIYTNIIDRIN